MIEEYVKGLSIKISDHFNSVEMDCHCSESNCEITYIDTDLIDYLEEKRTEIGKSIKILSGFRCVKHNRDVGGKKGSIHLTGKAADIQIPGQDMIKIANLFEDADGLGRYPGRHFLHVDVRGYKVRWEG